MFRKSLRIFAWIGAGVYILYVGAVAVVLNTPIFGNLTGMDNEDLTHVRFSGAISLFPGHLWASGGRVVIKDQNVSITIKLDNVTAWYDLLPLKKKRLEISSLQVKKAAVDIGMKKIDETAKYVAEYTKVEDADRAVRKQKIEEGRKTRLTLNFKKIIIDDLNEVTSGLGEFKGHLSLLGGFEIQPGVQVEVYPTTLTFHSGVLPGQFTEVQGKADVRLDRFDIFEAPGNAVFPFFNVKFALDVGVESLKAMNLNLNSLQGYSMSAEASKLKIRVDLVKGILQKGSFAETEPSEVFISSEEWVASGFGRVEWKVDQDDSSRLVTRISKVKLTNPNEKSWSGSLKELDLDMRLFGNNLVHAFAGIGLDLKLNGLSWRLKSPAETDRNLKYEGWFVGNGRIFGKTGNFTKKDEAVWSQKKSNLTLKLKDTSVTTSFLPKTKILGDIRVFAKPVDLGNRMLSIPKIETDLEFDVGKYGKTKSKILLTQVEYLLAPEVQWKGKVLVHMDQTTPFINVFRDRDEMSGIMATALRVKNLESKIDWEMGKVRSWIRVNEVNSDGVWKAYGSLLNDHRGMNGVFEAQVLGAPVGIRISPEKTETKLLPSKEWYDQKAN